MNTKKYYSPNFIMQYTQKRKCVRCRQPVCRCALTLYLAYHGLSASDLLSLNRVRLQTTRTPLFRYNGYNDRPYPLEYTSPYGPIEKPSGLTPNDNVQKSHTNGVAPKLYPNGNTQKPYIKEYVKPKCSSRAILKTTSSNEYLLKAPPKMSLHSNLKKQRGI
ncbi:uncharacterized protein LOC121737760 [Aricia agestis]|uniref:uncharacterized protein LOC121737760 n=1 Tax=Aricia agestis TaxID=91739 RepID=UPI001C20593F|nr:uncharacterized protein LOC121737760 [Aricia agestis]